MRTKKGDGNRTRSEHHQRRRQEELSLPMDLPIDLLSEKVFSAPGPRFSCFLSPIAQRQTSRHSERTIERTTPCPLKK